MTIAKETVAIMERGYYVTRSGRTVEIADVLARCLAGTRDLSPEETQRIPETLPPVSNGEAAVLELANETTLVGIARLAAANSGSVAALNFASAKNPGGGFLNGSEAQEESLARGSCLFASLSKAWTFYDRHRNSASLLYSDAMIYSPECPIIRDDEGELLDEPRFATFITSPAPNAGAMKNNRPAEISQVAATLATRGELVLALAAASGHRNLVLGAWGCGVFRNDPKTVAEVFVALLRSPRWSTRFDRVRFSVLDTSPAQSTFRAFESARG